MDIMNVPNLNKDQGSIIAKDWNEFAKMGRDFVTQAPTMTEDELYNSHKCLGLAYLSFEWPDTIIGNMHRERSAPIVMKLTTEAFLNRQIALGL